MKPLSDADYFPKDYANSRKLFLERAAEIPGAKQLGRWEVPGKEDKDLFVDHVWLPPQERSERLLVMTSGIHGPETYAGAAIQNMFIDEIQPMMDRRNTGVFIVHGMNPYGFKYLQRCTESGVNLNRNFSVSGELFKKPNEASAKICARFLDRKPVASMRSSLLERMTNKNGKIFFDEFSLDELIKGFSPGQHERPEDLEYGGRGPEVQTHLLIEKLKVLMVDFQDIIGFDLHTGLGDRNRLHLLTDGGKALHPELFEKLFRPEEDREIYAFTPAHSEGFYPVHGALNGAFGDLAKKHQRACSITMEFGTLGHSLEAQLEGLNDFFINHQGRFHGYANRELEQQALAANFARARPASQEWDLAVIKSSRNLFLKVLERAEALLK